MLDARCFTRDPTDLHAMPRQEGLSLPTEKARSRKRPHCRPPHGSSVASSSGGELRERSGVTMLGFFPSRPQERPG
jgi:hypothetical protein